MAVSHALRRLLRIRELEEEQSRQALEAAAEELRRLEAARAASVRWETRGRALLRASAHSGELAERIAGLEETAIAQRRSELLGERMVEANAVMEQRRAAFLDKRVERRQTETLVEEEEVRVRREQEKRSQQALDDGYGARPALRKQRGGRMPSAETEKT